MAAFLCLLALNYSINDILYNVKNIHVPHGRCELLNYGQNYNIILDYAHTTDAFNNIYEFLDEHKKLIIDDLNEIAEISKTHNKQNLVEVFTVLKKHPHFLNILISPNCDLDFFNEIFDVASSKASIIFSKDPNTLTNRERLLCSYCNAGCNAVIITWIMNDMKESPEEIADFIWTSSKNGIFSLLFPNEEFD